MNILHKFHIFYIFEKNNKISYNLNVWVDGNKI